MSERICIYDNHGNEDPTSSSFNERQHFMDPALLDTSTLQEGVAYGVGFAGLGAALIGGGIGWYWFKKGEAEGLRGEAELERAKRGNESEADSSPQGG